jgi:copper resistance protein B
MEAMMQMDDTAHLGMVLLDQLEWRHSSGHDAGVWDAQGWYGGDYDKLWLKTEGEHAGGQTEGARVELLWDRIVTRWWSVQAGAREDLGGGPPRAWAALGVQGLAPYWFDVEATLYAGESGRTAARLKTEYDLLLTQRLILQPQIELNFYGKPDPARRLGSGLSDLDAGIRLRYELRRELAPYVGVTWRELYGGTADQARAAGASTGGVQLAVGLRAWF